MRKLLTILFAAMLLFSAALAESITTIHMEEAQTVYLNGDGIRLTLNNAQGLTNLKLIREDVLLLEQHCGEVNGRFASDTIYLESNGEYCLSLTVGETVYSVTVIVERGPAPTEIGWL